MGFIGYQVLGGKSWDLKRDKRIEEIFGLISLFCFALIKRRSKEI